MKIPLPFSVFILYMFLPFLGNAQFIVITGNVINEKTGITLENVGVFETVSGIGTITNVSGFFSLMLKPGNAEFVITHSGFKDLSKKMVISADTTLTLLLAPQINLKSKSKDADHQNTAEKIEKNKLLID